MEPSELKAEYSADRDSPDVQQTGEAEARSIYELLHHTEAYAILAPGRLPSSHNQLCRQVRQTAAAVRAAGVGRNERVCIVLPNGPEMAVCFLGVATAATCAPLNPSYRESEFEFYFDELQPKLLILQKGAESPARQVAKSRAIPILELSCDYATPAGVFELGVGGNGTVDLAEPEDIAIVLHTSGTTSRPKIVPLSHRNLCASVRNTTARLALAQSDRCLNVMPLFHIHGLVGALLSSVAAGSSVVCTSGFHSLHFFDWFREFQPTWYTAVPAMHQAILERAPQNPDIHSRSRLRFIRSCSSALPPKLMATLENEFHVPVVEAFGMTEASHQISINPLPPGIRKPGSVGLPAGCEIAILDGAGALLPTGKIGAVTIRGPSVTAGYSGNPEVNRDAFHNGWLHTGDLGRVDADGYLFLCGRTKEIINRGGEKISPREVDDVLLEHPAVASAVAFSVPDTKLGEEIAAAVVLRENSAATEIELLEFASLRLAAFKVPRRIVFLDVLPKGPTGKVQRIDMAARLGMKELAQGTASSGLPFMEPRTRTETRLAELWLLVLQVKTVSMHDNFFQVGGDSVLAMQFCALVRDAVGVELGMVRLFETPTIAGLAAWIDSQKAGQMTNRLLPIRRAERGDAAPLSYAQRQLWFLERLEKGSANYVMPGAFWLRGPLDVDALSHSLDNILARHEILRTTYQERDGVPVQIVQEARAISVPLTDFSAIPEPERLCRCRQLAQEEAWRPFDLSADTMLRASLIRYSNDAHILLLTTHHIAADGWSIRLILRELAVLYSAKCERRNPILPKLSIQYADFALFQHQCFEDGRFEQQIKYWKDQLAGCPELLHLPTDRPRPDRQTYRGSTESLLIPHTLTTAIRNVGLKYQVTLYMTLLAAFQVLLHRYTDELDLVVGSPIAGRTNAGTEPLVGLFMNVLPFRANLSGDPSFREFLARTRETALGAYANQDVPTEIMIESLSLSRSIRHPALFQVLFQLVNLEEEATSLGPVAVERFDFDPGVGHFDLYLEIREKADGLHCTLNYNSDFYDSATARRILSHYRALLEAAVSDSGERISAMNILADEERRQLLTDWNETAAEYPQGTSIHELIAAQACKTPDAIAVVFRDKQLTYEQLDRCANGLAHRLRELGVARGDLVGIFMERSLWLPIAMLGVLKAGGAYVPLDPGYPKSHLSGMLEDAHCPVLITTTDHDGELPYAGGNVLYIDMENSQGALTRPHEPDIDVQAHDCAYVIFTSGSTGIPNGVQIEHDSLVNNSTFFARHMDLRVSDRILQFNSPSFDTAAEEIFPCWLAGATLVLWPEPEAPSIVEFLEFVERERITLLDLPTAYWHEWVNDISLSGLSFPSTVRAVVIGGEQANASKFAAWKKAVPGRVRLCNTYGPTEATITSTAYDANSDDRVADPVPIGRPNSNTTLYILDRHLQPVPIGVPGELFIGGRGIARGYLNRPDLTAKRFLANPFRDVPDPRLYKTGDRVRYLADGTVEFLGRVDDQVKWRGFRIELGALEDMLARHPHVRAVAASLRQETAEQFALVAYVVPDPAAPPEINELRSFLKERLPDYMLPSQYVLLEKLPHTPNGKVDRRALPQPDRLRPMPANRVVSPRTELESQIASIWEDVLGVSGIGVHDNFFDLGGHSLKVVQMLSRLRTALDVEVPLRRVFEGPTVAEISVAVLEVFADGLEAPEMFQILAEIDSDGTGQGDNGASRRRST